ncbi:MAG: deoxyribonuclease V [Proteobacteria bacterium]|nr:deoxyribonuclease V [Pseudomonadota bacterium]
MNVTKLHSWDLSFKEAVSIQRQLQKNLILSSLPKAPAIIAGADVSYDKNSRIFFSGIVLLTFPDLEIVEEVFFSASVSFPYIPGLLSFREGPVVLEAFKKLKTKPDLIVFDGQGIAHPRGLGIASHMGLILGIPSIGCAKTRLCGEFTEPGREKGDWSPLTLKGTDVGGVVRTKNDVKPVFVSPGHLIDIKSSIDVILQCASKYRLPEPTRQAHLLVNRVRLNSHR